ncbi:bile acid:sodium symporter [Sphingomonas azotifigens]|uniref:bile acid:sodium symporter n=1 Tax=Sphingomonas azotifigens TaxID=330920 RepID=UPI000A027B44|nr:AtzG-like protein [Sphingomonas azotifigens]
MTRVMHVPLRLDPFLLYLIAVVAAASVVPAQGRVAGAVGILADLAIAVLFFLQGAKLSRSAIVQGVGNWRLHGLVLGSTYLLFPALGLALLAGLRGAGNPLIVAGLLYLTLLPSTVQSSIAFTAIARGNVAAAVCSASLSNLIGIFLTPLLVGLLLRTGGGAAVSSWQAVESILLQLLAPFLAGHLLRPVIGGFVERHRKLLQPVDRGSILLVVYSAFSAAVVNGIWRRVGGVDLLAVVVLSAILLGGVMGANLLVARLARLPREDAIVLLFCGSKKSLVSGVPMAGALFAPAQVGLIVLPLMIFHQLQLFLCAALAGRYRQQAEQRDAVAVPRSDAEIAEASARTGLPIPEACRAGVTANLALLERHAATLRGTTVA